MVSLYLGKVKEGINSVDLIRELEIQRENLLKIVEC